MQLAPLATNSEAEAGGYTISLFRALCEAHPQVQTVTASSEKTSKVPLHMLAVPSGQTYSPCSSCWKPLALESSQSHPSHSFNPCVSHSSKPTQNCKHVPSQHTVKAVRWHALELCDPSPVFKHVALSHVPKSMQSLTWAAQSVLLCFGLRPAATVHRSHWPPLWVPEGTVRTHTYWCAMVHHTASDSLHNT